MAPTRVGWWLGFAGTGCFLDGSRAHREDTVTPPTPPTSAVVSPPGSTAWHTLTVEEVLQRVVVDPQRGLTSGEAQERSGRFGPNRFTAAKSETRLHAFLRQYADPMQIVLLVAGVGSLYPLKEWGTGILLLSLTVFNAVLGLRQEGKAAEAVAALQKMMIVKARVTPGRAAGPAAGRGAGARRRRRDRGRRHRPGRRAAPARGDAGGRRVGAHGREPAGAPRAIDAGRPAWTPRSATGATWCT